MAYSSRRTRTSPNISGRLFFCFCLLAVTAPAVAAADGPPVFDTSQLIGGLGDQQGLGLAAFDTPTGPAVAVAGADAALYGGQAVALLAGPDLHAFASTRWPNTSGAYDPDAEVFTDAAIAGDGLYLIGRSWAATTDVIGPKEPKAVVVKFPRGADGRPVLTAPAWVAAPSLFPEVQGRETFSRAEAATEAGQPVLYVAGAAASPSGEPAAVLAKFSAAGQLLWKLVLDDPARGSRSTATDVLVQGGDVYVAGTRRPLSEPSGDRVVIWKVSPDGAPLSRLEPGDVLGAEFSVSLACNSSALFALTALEHGPSGGQDLLAYSVRLTDGALLSKQAGGGPGDDVPLALATVGNRLFIAGLTTSSGAGGQDAFLMEVDATTGQVRATLVRGGTGNDRAEALIAVPGALVLAGTSDSFTEGGNLSGQRDVWLQRFTLPHPPAPDQPLQVAIDVKPGSDRNPLRLEQHHGKIPVAIMSTATFDAPSMVVMDQTLTFGRTGFEPSLAFCRGGGVDVNGDGLRDLICHFESRLAGFQPGDTTAILNGVTRAGRRITGRDTIRLVPERRSSCRRDDARK